MRDTAVAPVEEQVPAVLDEDVPVVEVVVLDRLRDPEGGEPRAALGEVGEAARGGGRTRPRSARLRGRPCTRRGRRGDARCDRGARRAARPERPRRAARRRAGRARAGARRTPGAVPSQRSRSAAEWTSSRRRSPPSRISSQPRPASSATRVGTWPGRTRSRIASSPASNACGGAFALNQRSPSAVGTRMHGRPPAHVRLLDLAGPLEPVLVQARVDPGGRRGEPGGLHPGEDGSVQAPA